MGSPWSYFWAVGAGERVGKILRVLCSRIQAISQHIQPEIVNPAPLLTAQTG
jgi:hypothetical protein